MNMPTMELPVHDRFNLMRLAADAPSSPTASVQHVFQDSFVLVASAIMSALRSIVSDQATLKVDVEQSSFLAHDGNREIRVECKMISPSMIRVKTSATCDLNNDSGTAAEVIAQTERLLNY